MKIVWRFSKIPEVQGMDRVERAQARKTLHDNAFGSGRGRVVKILAGLTMFILVFLLAGMVGAFYVRGGLQNTLITSTGAGIIGFFWAVFLETYAVVSHGGRLDEILAANLEQSTTKQPAAES